MTNNQNRICPHGRQKQNCKECKGSNICPHNRQKNTCKECKGSSVCEHGRIKSQCKECKGTGVCPHNRLRTRCAQCGGGSICEHGRERKFCKECKGGCICPHNKVRTVCKECGGGSICIHGRKRTHCRDCGGSAYCKHGRYKARCIECGGSQICEHGRQRYSCIKCSEKITCKHGILKATCTECKNTMGICEHGILKSRCKSCDGSALCKTPLCETRAIKKYQGYCYGCYIQMFPDNQIVRNHKTKERAVADYIREHFQEYTISFDRRIRDGCSLRKPDIFIDFGEYVLIIEIDENSHRYYDCSCENKRLMILFQDTGSRPLVMIRFNPDQYYDHNEQSITSCWEYTKEKGLCVIKKNKQTEWEQRLETLRNAIQFQIDYIEERKEIDVIHLFYDENI